MSEQDICELHAKATNVQCFAYFCPKDGRSVVFWFKNAGDFATRGFQLREGNRL